MLPHASNVGFVRKNVVVSIPHSSEINVLRDFFITYIFSKYIYIENVFLGREETLEDRTLQIECAPVTTAAPATTAAGRFDERQSNGKNQKYKTYFEFSISCF